jgi:hypothetical protein
MVAGLERPGVIKNTVSRVICPQRLQFLFSIEIGGNVDEGKWIV